DGGARARPRRRPRAPLGHRTARRAGGGRSQSPRQYRHQPMTRWGILATLALLPLAAACGYSWRGTLPPHIRTVGVPVFANHTQWPNIEAPLTAAVANAFATDGRLKVVRPEEADAVLEADIVNYQVSVLAFDSGANPQQYRLFVTLDVRFRDARRGVMLFEQRGLQERVDYLAAPSTGTGSPVVADTIARQDAGIVPVAGILARDIVARAVDPF